MAGNRSWPENSTTTFWWQTMEERVLRHLQEEAAQVMSTHLPLHLDDLVVKRDRAPVATTDVCWPTLRSRALEKASLNKISALKVHRSFSPAESSGLAGGLPTDLELRVTKCACAMALGQASSPWYAASAATMLWSAAGGQWTLTDWSTSFNGKGTCDPLVLCLQFGPHLPADHGACSILHVIKDFRALFAHAGSYHV